MKTGAITAGALHLVTIPVLFGTTTALARGPLTTAVEETVKAHAAAALKQTAIDKLDEQSRELLMEYRGVREQIDALKTYNEQLEQLIGSQNAEIDSLREQIDNATQVGREVTPLMLRMLKALEDFVRLDVPFLPEERQKRLTKLHEMMLRADVTQSEKYRRIVEAYQIENEYGRTIETYKDKIGSNGQQRTVDLLRIGRVVLIYQTLDGKEIGAWDNRKREWVLLGSEHRTSIKQAFRMARKQAAPDMVRLPVPAPEERK